MPTASISSSGHIPDSLPADHGPGSTKRKRNSVTFGERSPASRVSGSCLPEGLRAVATEWDVRSHEILALARAVEVREASEPRGPLRIADLEAGDAGDMEQSLT